MKLNQFTHLYPVSKTLRFELKPVGETADYIEEFKSLYLQKIVAQDYKRADNYQIIKQIIDDYHRYYIEEKLSNPCNPETGELYITEEDFENAFSFFEKFIQNPKDEHAKKSWNSIQSDLRKKLVKAFDNNDRLFGKEMINEDLQLWLQGKGEWDTHKEVVNSFKKFTTYFTGFNENRKNMYSSEDKSTAISFRLMNENLPKFFTNCIHYQTMQKNYPDLQIAIESGLLDKMGINQVSDVFQPSFFTALFTQTGIDLFNELLGGRTTDEGVKIKGLNEQINLFRQKNGIKPKNLPNLAILYKQILSDRVSHSFIPEQFANDRELLDALDSFIQDCQKEEGALAKLKKAVTGLQECDLDKTFIKAGLNITDMSQKIFSDYRIINNAVYHHVANSVFPVPKNGKVSETLEKNRNTYISNIEAYSMGELEFYLKNYAGSLDSDHEDKAKIDELFSKSIHPILDFYLLAIQSAENYKDNTMQDGVNEVMPLLKLEQLNKGYLRQEQTQKIQSVLDSFLKLAQSVKPLHLVKGRKPIELPAVDYGFYTDFSEAFENYENMIVSLYNKARNHLTKKPFSVDKIKINFENPTFLFGWDINKARGNNANIIRKNGEYFLAIMHRDYLDIFDEISPEGGNGFYERINYKLVSGINKMLPKVFFSKKGIETYDPPQNIIDIYNNDSFKKGDSFDLNKCHQLIDWYKMNVIRYKANPEDEFGWDVFNFQFSPTKNYRDINDFYREMEIQAYKIWFSKISESYINECVKLGKLFLFQIYNKDFSPYSKGKPNLHSLFWKAIFDPENLKDIVIKLNGEAEMFYRKHSINKDERIAHHANKTIANKNDRNPKSESLFEYEIVKDRRYTLDKFHFHVPITLNFKAPGVMRFNDQINLNLKNSTDTHVIGIDRGERHLLYYIVINTKGEIVEQGSFNTLKTDLGYAVDYRKKLDDKEKARDLARKSWTTVENIKELKAGYLSHISHQMALLIRKYNAIVCLEDLNFGFKRGRFKVEKQVYQKFEKALIDKLNYLVFKDAKADEPGHYLNAYQLTAPFDSFKKMGKQTGILFYVQAAYTSKIDPATGFINFLFTKYESLEKSKTFFEAFDEIRFNSDKDYFEFSFDYSKTLPGRELTGYRNKWTVCTQGDLRYRNQQNNGYWESMPVNVTAELKSLFNAYRIAYQNGQDLREAIALVKETKFYKKIYGLIATTFSLRQSKSGTDEDFILSPVADENGNFFDSRTAPNTLPQDADANGAYHIALKGLWNIEQIRRWDGKGKLNLAMKNADWFSFAFQKPFNK